MSTMTHPSSSYVPRFGAPGAYTGAQQLNRAALVLSWTDSESALTHYGIGTIYMAKKVFKPSRGSKSFVEDFCRHFILTSYRVDVKLGQAVTVHNPKYNINGTAYALPQSRVGPQGCLLVLLSDNLTYDETLDMSGNTKPSLRPDLSCPRINKRELYLQDLPPLLSGYTNYESPYLLGCTPALLHDVPKDPLNLEREATTEMLHDIPKYPLNMEREATTEIGRGTVMNRAGDCKTMLLFPPIPPIAIGAPLICHPGKVWGIAIGSPSEDIAVGEGCVQWHERKQAVGVSLIICPLEEWVLEQIDYVVSEANEQNPKLRFGGEY